MKGCPVSRGKKKKSIFNTKHSVLKPSDFIYSFCPQVNRFLQGRWPGVLPRRTFKCCQQTVWMLNPV